jgi:hypothetical protein
VGKLPQGLDSQLALTKLIKGKITVTPETSGKQAGVRFEATGTIEKLIAVTFSGVFSRLQGMASPGGNRRPANTN